MLEGMQWQLNQTSQTGFGANLQKDGSFVSYEDIERKISLKQKKFMRHEAVRVHMFDKMYQF